MEKIHLFLMIILSFTMIYCLITFIFSIKDKKYIRNTIISITLFIGCIVAFVLLLVDAFPEQYINVLEYFKNINFVIK